MKFRRITMAYILVTTACMKSVPNAPVATPALENSWEFQFQSQVTTQFVGDPVPGIQAEDLQNLRDALGDFEIAWSGTLSEGPYQINRDGTESWRLVFEEVLDQQELPQQLQGRAMETRRFPGGGLLSLQQTEWVSASDARGDGLDAMVALMYLLPPERREGKLLFTDFAWPYRLDSSRRSQHTAPLSWEQDGAHFRFKGPLSGRIQDRNWRLRADSNGQLQGSISISEEGEIEKTEFRVERTISFGLGESGAEVRQKQVLIGVLRPGDTRVVTPWPRPFYLQEDDILQAIGAAKADWESCSTQQDWSTELNFEIGTGGRVTDFEEDALGECSDVLRNLSFPPHHLPGLRVGTQLVIRSGLHQPYPSVRFPENPKPPLHLQLAPGSDAEQVVEWLQAWL
ncbi:MAG: hypothetical protein VXW32_09895 [Myxococcota bacterium]|nr:hypothetical protein [Myxococcota bacterium]